MQPPVIVPVHPRQCRQFQVVDAAPWTRMRWAVDEFVLVVAVHALGESIIVGIAHGPDRRYCTEFGEPFAVADRGELTARIAVAAKPGQPCAATEAGHLDGVGPNLGQQTGRAAGGERVGWYG